MAGRRPRSREHGGDRGGEHGHGHDGPAAPGGHAHGPGAGADSRYLLIALALLAAFMVAEVIVAVVSGSLALLSDAGHMLADVGAIGGALWAIRLAARPAAGAWTFGWKRAEILSAAGNGITLLVVSGIVTVEAVSRLIHPPAVDGRPGAGRRGGRDRRSTSPPPWVLARAEPVQPERAGRVPARAHRPVRVHRHRRRPR